MAQEWKTMLGLVKVLAGVHSEAFEEKGPRKEPALAPENFVGNGAGGAEFLGEYLVYNDLLKRLGVWPPGREVAIVRECRCTTPLMWSGQGDTLSVGFCN